MKKSSLGLAFALVGIVFLGANPKDDAEAAMEREDYAATLVIVSPLALKGVAWAQAILADQYRAGLGVPKDSSLAINWARKAADQGDANGQCTLGNMYFSGDCGPKDAAIAANWFRKSAMQGYAPAQEQLGYLYVIGEGVPKDPIQAYMWTLLSYWTYGTDGDWSRYQEATVDDLMESMSSSQIQEAEQRAKEWTPSLTKQ